MAKRMIVFLILIMFFAAYGATWATAETTATRYSGMFDLYEKNREQGIGNYITVDFILTAYSLFTGDLITLVEEKEILPAYRELVDGLTKKLQKEKKTKGRETALAYVSVIKRLLDPKAEVPKEVAPVVKEELALIAGHKGIKISPVMGVREDYSQYLPRGKYAASEPLKKYFRAMMFAGRMGFYLKESRATGVSSDLADQHTGAALLLSRTLTEDARLKGLYDRIQALLDFFVGPADDLTPDDYIAAGGSLPPEAARKKILAAAKASGRLPRIISVPVDRARLEKGVSLEEAIAGFRLMGQRYTPESDAFQNLVFDRVTDYTGKDAPFTMAVINGRKVRGFPTVLDLMAGLGSEKAGKLLVERGDTAYKGYDTQFKTASALLKAGAYNPASLNNVSLKTIHTLLAEKPGAGLNGALGLWILNRHNLNLYAKQSYTVVAKSIGMAPERARARVEPAVDVYDDLIEGLYLISEVLGKGEVAERIMRFREALGKLRALAYKQEEIPEQFTVADCSYLNNLDRLFGGLLSKTDAPVVVDIHTEANSAMVLELGTGDPIPVQYEELRGARFNCCEFKQPMDQRLTDEAWQKMLKEGAPEGSLSRLLLE